MNVLRDCETLLKKIARKHGISYSLIFGSYRTGYTFEESDILR